MVFLTISDLNERLIRDCVSSKKIYRVDNISDIMEIKQVSHSHSNMFLFVGRLSEEKGIEVFCQAIERLIKGDERIRGCVVGDGQLKEQLKSQYPMIEFVGWKNKSEVWEYMADARALVFPSKWYEGAPLTIVEALSAGLPCVVSDCTSAIELIHDGVNGAVFYTDSFEHLYMRLHELLDDGLIEEYQKNINNTFNSSKYSDETHTNRLIQVYNTELDRNS